MVLALTVLFLPGAVQAEAKAESLNSSVKKFIRAARKLDEKQLNKYVKDWEEYSLAEMKEMMPKTYRVIKKNASKVSYKVVSKKKKGNTATVILRVKYPRYTKAMSRVVKALEDYFDKKYGSSNTSMEVPSDLSQKEIEKLLEEMLEEMDTLYAREIRKGPKSGTADKKIKVTFAKSGSRWVIKKMPKALANAMFCDLINSAEKAASSLE